MLTPVIRRGGGPRRPRGRRRGPEGGNGRPRTARGDPRGPRGGARGEGARPVWVSIAKLAHPAPRFGMALHITRTNIGIAMRREIRATSIDII